MTYVELNILFPCPPSLLLLHVGECVLRHKSNALELQAAGGIWVDRIPGTEERARNKSAAAAVLGGGGGGEWRGGEGRCRSR